jgi:hypothetical protein
MSTPRMALLIIVAATMTACDNPFAPTPEPPGPGGYDEPAPPAITPGQLIDNLHRAMRDRDKDLYETLLDEDFWFTETDCMGDLVFANGREEEIEILGGSRDGSRPGIFDIYRSFEFDFEQLSRTIELGEEYPDAYEGDPDGHPDEDWVCLRGQVEMELLEDTGEGFHVSQTMTYKLRLTEEGVWKIIRWVDDPLDGDCNPGKRLAHAPGWSAVKQSLTP